MNTKDSQEHLSVNKLNQLIEKSIQEDPGSEIFSIIYEEEKFWVKRARKTGSNLLHKFAFFLSKNPIVTPVETKTDKESLKFESSKLQRLYALSIAVPKVIDRNEKYFIIEDCGQTVKHLIKNDPENYLVKLLDKIVTQLATLHNLGEFHGGSQIKNFTYKNGKVYFIDFEESFNRDIDIKELQFRDLFLFLFSLSKLNTEINYESLLRKYITLTKNRNVIEKFHTLTSKVSFLMKLVENKIVWSLIDSDTKSIYRLLQDLKKIN
jgi:tRNA A-37 threonylcarbamoyl transferase component Bud32